MLLYQPSFTALAASALDIELAVARIAHTALAAGTPALPARFPDAVRAHQVAIDILAHTAGMVADTTGMVDMAGMAVDNTVAAGNSPS